jgi:hypothetical protein
LLAQKARAVRGGGVNAATANSEEPKNSASLREHQKKLKIFVDGLLISINITT